MMQWCSVIIALCVDIGAFRNKEFSNIVAMPLSRSVQRSIAKPRRGVYIGSLSDK